MSQLCYSDPDKPKTGLVLTGGGARAAFQVGAVRAISDIIYRKECGNPFPIKAEHRQAQLTRQFWLLTHEPPD